MSEVKRGAGYRENNPFWKGGRSVASNGYVLIKVGRGHHLSDVRGYAYEHRLNAEKKIGRKLAPGELVHHIDGNKQNNDERNLEVVASIAEHLVKHRISGKALRMPNEGNPDIPCECGCGDLFSKYDSSGRPRRFISGHNSHPNPTESAIIFALSDGKLHHRSGIIERSKLAFLAVVVCLSKMKRKGLVENSSGHWRLTGRAIPPQPIIPASHNRADEFHDPEPEK